MTTATPIILGIETSCDETAAAVLAGDGTMASSVLASQHDIHSRYGGVVPELAARRHLETISEIVSAAMTKAQLGWSDIDAIAVTTGPGLAGALLVGVSFAKALAYARGLPLIGVNHLEAHIASAWLEDPRCPLPCVALVVSGGHTHLYRIAPGWRFELFGQTLDDAAGEAFDKGAKMLGLPYPGGPAIDRLARTGNPASVQFPRGLFKSGNLDFSFSGLKTALLYHLRRLDRTGQPRVIADLAAAYQEAIVDVLTAKAMDAVRQAGVGALAVVGGVSANSRLRERLTHAAMAAGIHLVIPRILLCTDNAAMVAAAGRRAFLEGRRATFELEADPNLSIAAREVRAAPRQRAALGKRRS